MKIELRRLFAYPVLAEERDDYKACRFFAESKYNLHVDAGENLVFDIKLSTDCAEINRLIACGDAGYLFHVECPTTIYRKVFNHSDGNFVCKIPLSLVKDKLYRAAFIVLRRAVKAFSCNDWNADFDGLTFDLPKGSILAYKNFEPLPLVEDPNLFKNVGSIFSVYRRLDDDSAIVFDLTAQKIRIGLHKKDYALYRRYCENPTLQPLLNALIIFPVLAQVFDELKQDMQEHESDAWFVALKAAFKRRATDLSRLLVSEDSLKLAQEVMGFPASKALESIAIISDDASEVS